ncbi:hypothetical protein DPMN_088519 [Dreissena polymorpha]|uniref:Uncharacterized protein n=1 Tax=Dreissena polymorpha TaxID=45954 RepID=A0A9D4KUQ0_DREPO|nr:hypothetical protein DPMN_088519 [Dreissena polymorpha]
MHKIQMFTVGTGKLVMGMNYQLTHSCYGIAHHQGMLYITTSQALYQYTTTGTLVRTLYEDKTNNPSGMYVHLSSKYDQH